MKNESGGAGLGHWDWKLEINLTEPVYNSSTVKKIQFTVAYSTASKIKGLSLR